jgi:site-specific recombinase XerD
VNVGEIIGEVARESEVRREEQAEHVFRYSDSVHLLDRSHDVTIVRAGLIDHTREERTWVTSSSRWLM